MNSTKENILLQALHLFAADGYEAVSVSRIAEALGITKGALYKHYKNKWDIFNNILIRMEQNDLENAKEFELPEGPISEMEEQKEGFLWQFVAEPKIVSRPLSQMGITQQLEQMGYETSTKVINIGVVSCPSKMAKRLSLEPGTDVTTIKRLRFVKGEPLSIHTSYIPLTVCSDLEMQDFEHNQLCDIMEQVYHHEIIRRVETLESTTASIDEAELLSVRPAFPLLLLNTTMYTTGDLPVECSAVVFRGDKFKIKLEFNKT